MTFSNNPILFGKMSGLLYDSKLNCTILNMLMNNVISFDGMIDRNALSLVKKKELWAYMYYIWKTNRYITEFKDEPSSEAFRNLVLSGSDDLFVTKSHLCNIINIIINQNRDKINISIISTLLNTIQQKINKEETVLLEEIKKIDSFKNNNIDTKTLGQIRDSEGNLLPSLDIDVKIKSV